MDTLTPADTPDSPPFQSASDARPSDSVYNRVFWLAFVANVLLVTANTLTFRFAEFVTFLGGTEEITGRIVSIGLVGSLCLRLFLGPAIDRIGVRRVWLASSLVYATGCLLIITATDLGPQIYLARMLFILGLASMAACSISHIQSLAPPHRRTEVIATFGASGFIGMILGAQLGDVIFQTVPVGETLFHVLFGLTLLFGVFHVCLAARFTAGDPRPEPAESAPLHQLLIRYWPPLVLIVTLMMGLGFSVTMVFLTRYATELGLSGIRTFFTAYAISAFTMRLVARNWSRTIGRHRMIVLGLCGHAIGQFLLTFVTRDWHFIPSALCLGFGHALLFPCVVSLGAGAFPTRYRGTGTTITLASIDVGTILTAPFIGWMIDTFGFHPTLYVVSAILAASAVVYGTVTGGIVDGDTLAFPASTPPVIHEPRHETDHPQPSRVSSGAAVEAEPARHGRECPVPVGESS